ncbi:MAG: hypothetical protein MUP74_04905, partial [Desulfobacterales bacterium]|nr:hypothetical protein [Desulfobacterales bacterium]
MCTLSTANAWLFRQKLYTALVLLIGLSGCSGDAGYKPVNFSDAVTMAYAPVPKPERGRLRVAVAAMISPQETFIYYRELIDYIGERLDRDIELVQRKTYGEINE